MPRNLLFCAAFLLIGCSANVPENTSSSQPIASTSKSDEFEPDEAASNENAADENVPDENASDEENPSFHKATPIPAPPDAASLSDLPLRLPAPAIKPRINEARLAPLKEKIAKYKLFAAYRELADSYLDAGLYQEAAQTLRAEAAQYRLKKLNDAAIIDEQRAARYDPTTTLYLERKASDSELKTLYSSAPLEPLVGCYLGAFIDRSSDLTDSYRDENFQTHRRARDWAQFAGKPHGSHFMYLAYGQKFPRQWIAELKAQGAIPQIAWEPKNLNDVQDDTYLRDFAEQCRDVDWPIFFRFASEMNGDWTPYHNNPALYRQKFALVHKVLHRRAPRIATIWCVNNPPLGNIDAYYPGDANCDWVGINFYAVPFYQNNRKRPAFDDSPLALLDPIYRKYASRKPIAICEFAASHRAALDNKDRPQFAIQKLAMVYGALPRKYPRVKLIDWFDMNTIANPSPGKTLNDYTLGDLPQVLAAYQRVTSAPYFLSQWQTIGSTTPQLPLPIGASATVRGVARLSIWSNLQLEGTKTFAKLGDKIVYASSRPGAHEINLDLSGIAPGAQKFTVFIYDQRNRFVTSQSTILNVQQVEYD